MHNEFTAVFERDGDWIIGYCPEIPGANGQCLTSANGRIEVRIVRPHESTNLDVEPDREGG